MTGIHGSHFRRVALDADPERRGFLGLGSFTLVAPYGNRSSPVLRSKWC
jgi:hypothetical protein